jgi:hypothetical protein
LKVDLMIKEHVNQDGVIMPDELAMLQRVFDTAIARKGHDRDSMEAAILAARVMDLFLRGIREETQLRALLAA